MQANVQSCCIVVIANHVEFLKLWASNPQFEVGLQNLISFTSFLQLCMQAAGRCLVLNAAAQCGGGG